MKWFKHMTNMHLSNSVERFCSMHKDYLKGYGFYCLLIELCAEKLDKNKPAEFIFSKDYLKNKMRMKWKCVENELIMMRECSDNEVIIENFYVIIKMPKLRELLDNSTRNLQATCKNDFTELEEDIRKKNNNNNNIASVPKEPKQPFDLDALYQEYPNKIGKKAGMKKLGALIKSEKDYQNFLLAIRNYKSINISQEKKYLKHFSTFVNNWEDYLEIECEEFIDPATIDTSDPKANFSLDEWMAPLVKDPSKKEV